MGLFKSRYEKDLDDILDKIRMNMANNYKDAAQEALVEFEQAFEAYEGEGKIKGDVLEHYRMQLSIFQSRLAGFTHKDQKPFWT